MLVECRIHLHHVTLLCLKFLLQESRQIHLAHETDALGILLVGRRQVRLCSQTPDLRLADVTNREKCSGKLLLGELAEEIALVLVGVAALENPVNRCHTPVAPGLGHQHLLSICVFESILAAIMPGGNTIRPQFLCRFPKCRELDFPVAQHIRVGSPSGRIFRKHIVHHLLAVFLAQIHKIERYSNLAGHHLRHKAVLFPFALSVQGGGGIVPVLHKQSEHIISLPLEQQGSHTGVNPS